MALTRKFLEAMSLSGEQIQAIIDEHTSVTDALKAQRDKFEKEAQTYKAEADKVPEIQKELDILKGGEDFKSKYEQEKKAFEDFKADLTKKEEAKKVEAAYRKLLTDEQIKADKLEFIINHTDLSKAELDKDGNLKDAETFKKEINDNVNGWGAFKVSLYERKPIVATPPRDTTGTPPSRARDIYLNHLKQQGVKVEDTGRE